MTDKLLLLYTSADELTEICEQLINPTLLLGCRSTLQRSKLRVTDFLKITQQTNERVKNRTRES